MSAHRELTYQYFVQIRFQDITRRKAQGIRMNEDGEEIEEEEYDPFGPNMDEFTMSDSKAVSWSYSKYMDALDGEKILNEVDTNTFTDLSRTSGKTTIFT